MMLLVGIEEKNTPNALTVPRRGDSVTWALGIPAFSTSTRSGIVTAVWADPFEGWTFDATINAGLSVWGYLGNILAVNGEAVPNSTMRL